MGSIDEESAELPRVGVSPCPGCGQPVDAMSPTWLRINFEFGAGWGSIEELPHLLDRCTACELEALSPMDRAQWLPTAVLLRDTRAETFLRPSSTLVHQRIPSTVVSRGTGGVYDVDFYFVFYRGDTPSDWKVPFFKFPAADGAKESQTLIILRIIVSLEGVSARAVYTWDSRDFVDGEGKLEIRDWAHSKPRDQIRLMKGAARLMAEVPRGRPMGTKSRTLDECLSAYRAFVAHMGKPAKNMGEFSVESGIPYETMRDYLPEWGLTWTAFKREATRT